MTRVAILGAGNGGCAAAADLTRRGFQVSLYSRSEPRLAPFQELGGLHYTGVIGEGFAPLDRITTDLAEAIEGSELVIIITPATAHAPLIEQLHELLPENTPVWLNPGSTGGALHVAQLLRERHRADVAVAETATLTYACRMQGPTTIWIKNEVTNLPFATIPGIRNQALLEQYRQLYPNLTPAPNALVTSLMNLNAIMHPVGMVMNAGWIEDTQGDFKFYYHGVTPAVARVIEAVDSERMALVTALQELTTLELPILPCIDFFYQANYTTKEAWQTRSMYEALQASVPNRPTQAASSLNNRYLVEDVPFGLVPMITLAEWAGTATPTMVSVAQAASALMGVDYFATGLTLSKMGLDRITPRELERYLYTGTAP